MRQCKDLSGMKNEQTLQIKKAHVPEKEKKNAARILHTERDL